jgi:hypothetical protein
MESRIKTSFNKDELKDYVPVRTFASQGSTLEDNIELATAYANYISLLGYNFRLSLLQPPTLYIHESEESLFLASQIPGTVPIPRILKP